MPKSQRSAKRRHHEMTPTLSTAPINYVSNVQMAEGEDSIDNILEEMAGQQGISLSPSIQEASRYSLTSNTTATTTTIPQTLPIQPTVSSGEDANDTATTSTTVAKLFNATIPTLSYTKQQLNKIRSWNKIMNTWQRTGTFSNTSGDDESFVPSFDVEMTRHFKVQAISAYLLDTCKGLKMPAFERWLIDSKVEEDTYTYSSSTKFDPVLSGNVTVQYQSSQRLIDEICEMNDKKKESTKTPVSTTKPTKKPKPSSATAPSIMTRNNVKKVVQELCRRTNTAVLEISQQQSMYQQSNAATKSKTPPIKRGDRIELEGHPPVYTLVYHRDKKWKKPYCIKLNASHYNKLYTLFVQVHNHSVGRDNNNNNDDDDVLKFQDSGGGKLTMTTHVFHYLVMILLLRYSSLSGGQLLLDWRGGGMQGAVHDSVFDTLSHVFLPSSSSTAPVPAQSHHHHMVECFASPLNAYLVSGYYSAFAADLDWHFGSRGNFLQQLPTSAAATRLVDGSCCEANPPFAPGIMSAMADRIRTNIEWANAGELVVTYCVICPHGGSDTDVHRAAAKRYGSIALAKMTESEHCTYHFILPAKEHGYIEGAQHLRPTRYKESLYDTSIVVLQSTKARAVTEARTDHKTFEEQIRQAFVSRHRTEVESRK